MIPHTTGYERCPVTKSSRVGAAFLFAIETDVRAGEIAGVEAGDVDLVKQTCRLPATKNGTNRTVPLSLKTVRILKQVDCDFHLSSDQISSRFCKARDMTGIENLSSKLEALELARMVGIRDLKILMVHFKKSAEDIAK